MNVGSNDVLVGIWELGGGGGGGGGSPPPPLFPSVSNGTDNGHQRI